MGHLGKQWLLIGVTLTSLVKEGDDGEVQTLYTSTCANSLDCRLTNLSNLTTFKSSPKSELLSRYLSC